MPETRRIRQVLKSRATIEGGGVHLHRAIGFGPPEQYDPFLLESREMLRITDNPR